MSDFSLITDKLGDIETSLDNVAAELQELTKILRAAAATERAPGYSFPLDKRECLFAMMLMGLSSRLLPVHGSSPQGKQLVVDLAFELSGMAVQKSESTRPAGG